VARGEADQGVGFGGEGGGVRGAGGTHQGAGSSKQGAASHRASMNELVRVSDGGEEEGEGGIKQRVSVPDEFPL
jgi:hypothetical protein